MEENGVAFLFDNDDDILIEPVQESGDPDIDMIPADLHSQHLDHYSVPPTTDSDRDIAMPEDSESEDDQHNRRQPSSKLNSSTQSVRGNLNVHYYNLNLYFLLDFGSTSEGFR